MDLVCRVGPRCARLTCEDLALTAVADKMLIDATHPEETRVVVLAAIASRNSTSRPPTASSFAAISISPR